MKKIIIALFAFVFLAFLYAQGKVVTGDEVTDRLTNLALDEVQKNINPQKVFAAGANWPTAWTRDMSYAINLSLSFLFPQTVEKTLESRAENNMILQDTGSGGSYPVSTDRVVWALAAYDYALVKQDETYFNWIYDVISNTLEWDYNTVFDFEKGLYRGETSFIDWREQSYPRWMDSTYIAESCAFGTNVVFYEALEKAQLLAKRLGKDEDAKKWNERATFLKASINRNFWISSKNYYGDYFITNNIDILYEGFESLGTSLCVLSGVCPSENAFDALNAVKPGEYGMSTFAPQLVNVPPYHNDSVWPFVQGYRILALKEAGDAMEAEKEFEIMKKMALEFGTFKENYVASTGSPETQTNSDRQLWSDAGYLAVIYRILCGINLANDGIKIRPMVFDYYKNGITATEIGIGGTVLNLKINGQGDKIFSFKVNNKTVENDFTISYGSGVQDIEINLEKSQKFEESYTRKRNYNFDATAVQKPIPLVNQEFEEGKVLLTWKQKNSEGFEITKNGKLLKTIKDREYISKPGKTADFIGVRAIDTNAVPTLFGTFSRLETEKNTTFIEAEDAEYSGGNIKIENDTDAHIEKLSYSLEKTYANYGKYIEKWGEREGDFITFTFNAKEKGNYLIDFRYMNGHGPVNTGEKCAIRGVYLDDSLVRRLAFAQQGRWVNWDFSAPVKVHLSKGIHKITLKCDEYSYSQHHKINYINVDLCRVAKIK